MVHITIIISPKFVC